MVDRKNFESISGRGLPHYLLDRVDNDSNIESDSISRTLSITDSSVTAAKETDVSNTLINDYTSLLYVSSVHDTSDATFNSQSCSSQYESSSNLPFISDKSHDSSTTCSDDPSDLDNTYLINTIHTQAPEISMLSVMSSMDISSGPPICLSKDIDDTPNTLFDDPFYSNYSTEVEKMFLPDVSLIPNKEDEQESQRRSSNSSHSLFCFI